MRTIKTTALSLAVLAGMAAMAAPAEARPHRHQVCHMERHHGHHVRVCHWRR